MEINSSDNILSTVYNDRPKIEENDQFVIRNVLKEKKIPGTKSQTEYLGPFTAERVTPTSIKYTPNKISNTKTVSNHLAKKYFCKEKVLRIIPQLNCVC